VRLLFYCERILFTILIIEEMSSSDYTNLRRIRHVYYPSLNNCHAHTQPIVHTPPMPNQCYVQQPCQPNPYTVSHCHTGVVHHCAGHVNCNCQNHINQEVCHSHNEQANSHCNHCQHQCIHETNSICHPTPVIVDNSNHCVPDRSSLTVSKREYLLSPNFYGSTTFTVDCYVGFRAGMKVNCMSDLSSNNYFEGVIYNYHAQTGEITIYKLASINGDFSKPSKYIVSIIPAFQELDLLRERMAKVYLELFGIDISGPIPPSTGGGGGGDGGGGTVDVTTENTQIKNLYNYFFGEDITTESGYAATTTYLTTKINSLYTYFFDIDLTSSTNSSFNPNGNNVSLDSLSVKVQQLNLYFFGNANLTSLTA